MNNIKNIFRNGILMAAGLAALCACSDTWDDHYDANGNLSYDGTTMDAIQEKASDFAEVLVAAGMEKELNSESAYTLWVPANGTFDKDAILDKIKNGGKKDVVKRFINSHMARYNVSLGTEAQTVKLLNSKLVEMGTLNAPTFGSTTISSSNLACKNGVIHVIDGENEYVPNLYEAISDREASATTDINFYKFLEECDSFILDEERSLSYGVDEDGLPIYVDSVTERWNRALVGSEIFEEDSNFVVIAPSPEAFAKRYEIARSLLKFNPSEDKKKAGRVDSLTHTMAGRFAMKDLIYNMNSGKNAHVQDSLVSTDYVGYSYWEQSRYYRPLAADGILSPANRADSVKCSNGIIYFVNDYPFSETEQFFYQLRITPSNSYVNRKTTPDGKTRPYATENAKQSFGSRTVAYRPQEIHLQLKDTTLAKVETFLVDSVIDTVMPAPSIRQVSWLACEPTTGTASVKYSFELPNTLSGKYNIKIVTIPIWAKNGYQIGVPNNTLYKFSAELYQKQNGEEAVVTEVGEYESSGETIKKEDGDKNFVTKNFIVDENGVGTVLYNDTVDLGDHVFKSCYYGMDEPGVILRIIPGGKTAEVKGDATTPAVYTKELLLSKIILTPIVEESAESNNKRR